jgi:hypothetical protein
MGAARLTLTTLIAGLSGAAVTAVCRAVQLTVIDPEWGRNTLLWPVLDRLENR